MKKKTKIILSCVLGVAVLGGVATAVTLSNKKDSMTGGVTGGTYGWHTYKVHIEPYTENGEGYHSWYGLDHIYNVYVELFPYGSFGKYFIINYDQTFNWYDDLEVYFVITDGKTKIKTDVNTSHLDWEKEHISIASKDHGDVDMRNFYICEIGVRTDD